MGQSLAEEPQDVVSESVRAGSLFLHDVTSGSEITTPSSAPVIAVSSSARLLSGDGCPWLSHHVRCRDLGPLAGGVAGDGVQSSRTIGTIMLPRRAARPTQEPAIAALHCKNLAQNSWPDSIKDKSYRCLVIWTSDQPRRPELGKLPSVLHRRPAVAPITTRSSLPFQRVLGARMVLR